MNKLLDIKRAGGFPVDAEVIELLYNYKDYIESILGGLELAAGSVLFLEANRNEGISGYYLTDSYVYVVPVASGVSGSNAGKIKGNIYKLKADSTITIADLLAGTAAKLGLQINEIKYSTVDEYNVTYSDYMSVVEAVLIVDNVNPYKFYNLYDIVERSQYKNVSLSSLTLPDNYSFNDKHRNVFKYNLNRVEMQLSLNYTGPGTGMMTMLEIPITASVAVQLQIAVGAMYPISMCIYNATNIINVPCVLYRENISTFKIIADTINVTINSNSVVELKGNIVL